MSDLPKPPKVPCGTCPYRKDVPSGVWERSEYEKLVAYDGDTPQQLQNEAFGLFMCHQRDGCLCGGWLLTHDRDHLLALRMNPVDDSVWDYNPGTPVHPSGKAAHDHGVKEIDAPSPAARKKIDGLIRTLEE